MSTGDSGLADEMFKRVIAIVNLLMSAPEGLAVADIAHAVGAAPSIVRDDLLRLAEYGRAPLAVCCASDKGSDDDSEDDWLAPDPGSSSCSTPDPQDEIWSLASRDFAFPVTGLTPLEARMLLAILARDPGADCVKQRLQVGLASSGSRRRVVKAGRTVYGDGQEESKIDALGAYVAERASIRLVYIDRHGRPTQRDTCPTALVYDWRTCAWYLYGYNGSGGADGRFRHFRVSRIQSFGPGSCCVAAPEDSLVEEHVKSCWGVECSSVPVEVVVRFSDDFNVLDRLYADTADRPGAQYETQPDGSVIYRDVMPGHNEFRAWVATFGESAEILEPAVLRRSMVVAVQRVLDRYAELDCTSKQKGNGATGRTIQESRADRAQRHIVSVYRP